MIQQLRILLTSADTSSSSQLPRPAVEEGHRLEVNLPRLDAITFSGFIGDYPAFIAGFKTTVDAQTRLTGLLKLQYLQRAVADGSAAALIQGLTTDEDYLTALQLLQTEYGDTDVQLQGLFQRMKHLPVLRSPTDFQQLHDFRNELEVICRGLEHLKVDTVVGLHISS